MTKKSKITDPSKAEQSVGEALSRTDRFIENNLKAIIVSVAVVTILVVGILGVRHAYFLPKEKEAQAAIFPGENYFGMQEWDMALNGDSLNYMGFLGVIDDYGFTSTGRLAKAYAGICYYHLGDYTSAIDYLKKYKGKDKAFTATVTGLIGDCYVDMGDAKQGIIYFKKAATLAKNSLISPIYLKKAAVASEELGDYKSALAFYQSIKKDYSDSQEARTIDKYILRAESLAK